MTQKNPTDYPSAPDASTFASALGQVVWLMTVSKEHRDLPVRYIEERITPAILLQQFKIYMKGKQPVAFIAWAAASKEVAKKIASTDYVPLPTDWRSGEQVVVVECISPFASQSEVMSQFQESLAAGVLERGKNK